MISLCLQDEVLSWEALHFPDSHLTLQSTSGICQPWCFQPGVLLHFYGSSFHSWNCSLHHRLCSCHSLCPYTCLNTRSRRRYHPWGKQLSALKHGWPSLYSAPSYLPFTFSWRLPNVKPSWNPVHLLPQKISLTPYIYSVPWTFTVHGSCLSLSAAPPKQWAP